VEFFQKVPVQAVGLRPPHDVARRVVEFFQKVPVQAVGLRPPHERPALCVVKRILGGMRPHVAFERDFARGKET
jgi:hypothetical protein